MNPKIKIIYIYTKIKLLKELFSQIQYVDKTLLPNYNCNKIGGKIEHRKGQISDDEIFHEL